MIPKHDDLVPSIKGPSVRSNEKRPTAAPKAVQAVRYNIDFSTTILQQHTASPLVLSNDRTGKGARPAPDMPPSVENLCLCAFERRLECATAPSKLQLLEVHIPSEDKDQVKRVKRTRAQEAARHLTRYVVDGSEDTQAITVPVSEYEDLQCLLLYLPDAPPAETEATTAASMTTSTRTAEVVPLSQPLYLLRGERTKDAATTGEGISNAWQEVNQMSGGRFNKRDWKSMEDGVDDDTYGYAKRGKVNTDVSDNYDGDADEARAAPARPRAGAAKSKPVPAVVTKAKAAQVRPSTNATEQPAPSTAPSSLAVDMTTSLLDLNPSIAIAAAAAEAVPPSAEPPRKVLKLGEALRKTPTPSAESTSNMPQNSAPPPPPVTPQVSAAPTMDEATDAAALPSIAAAHIQSLLRSPPTDNSAVVVPLRELEQKILKQLPSYPAVAAMFKDRAQAGAATAWFKSLRAQLHVYVRGQKYMIDPKDNVMLTPR